MIFVRYRILQTRISTSFYQVCLAYNHKPSISSVSNRLYLYLSTHAISRTPITSIWEKYSIIYRAHGAPIDAENQLRLIKPPSILSISHLHDPKDIPLAKLAAYDHTIYTFDNSQSYEKSRLL